MFFLPGTTGGKSVLGKSRLAPDSWTSWSLLLLLLMKFSIYTKKKLFDNPIQLHFFLDQISYFTKLNILKNIIEKVTILGFCLAVALL